MISRLFYQLINIFLVFFRTVRAYFVRSINRVYSNFKRITNFSREAARAVPKVLQSAAVVGNKPTKREDYVETERLYISKSFIVTSILIVLLVGFLIYFVVWPFLLSRFFTARMFIEDARVETYSGKVILYYDKEKKFPMFKGRLVEGLAQGPGIEYDDEKYPTYEGEFIDGARQGKGKLYNQGVLTYDGTFENGVFSGSGSQYDESGLKYIGEFREGEYSGQGVAYKNGNVVYRGGFTLGVYDGEGILYGENGCALYKGYFSEGLRSGQGIEYFEDGEVQYRGTFFEDLYDDRGVLYDNLGKRVYEGGFSSGLYSGDGVLYLDKKLSIEGKFEEGELKGIVRMYDDGRLFYEGMAYRLLPHGFGTYFAMSKPDAIYRGTMSFGTIDGKTLLGISPDEAYTIFADAIVKDSVSEKSGFSIYNPQLGLSMFFTLKTEDSDPMCIRAYWYAADTDSFGGLPWRNPEEFEEWRTMFGLSGAIGIRTAYDSIAGEVPFDSKKYFRTTYYFEDEVVSLWSRTEGGEIFLVEWIDSDTKVSDRPDEKDSEEEITFSGRTEDLLKDLGLSEEGGSGGGSSTNEYYDGGKLSELLTTDRTAAEMSEILWHAVDYFEYAERRVVLEQQQMIRKAQLERATDDLQKGTGSQKEVDNLTSILAALDLDISRCIVGMEKARSAVLKITGKLLDDFNLQEALFITDPSTIDVNSLRYAVILNNPAYASDVNIEMMNLELAYQELLNTLDTYDKAKAEIKRVEADYEMGKATDAEKDAAIITGLNARSALYSQLALYSKSMLTINTMSGNWLAKQCGYFTDKFTNAKPENPPVEEPTLPPVTPELPEPSDEKNQ